MVCSHFILYFFLSVTIIVLFRTVFCFVLFLFCFRFDSDKKIMKDLARRSLRSRPRLDLTPSENQLEEERV